MKHQLVALCLLASPASAGGIDFGPDKLIHFGMGYGAAVVVERLELDVHPVVAACAVGVLKEAIDSRRGGTGWDNMDVLFTCAGGLGWTSLRWEW